MRINRLFFAFIFLLTPFFTQAQSDLQTGGHFGFKFGPSITKTAISGESANIPHTKLDFHLGLMYRYRMHKLVVQPEVIYAIKGGTFVNQSASGTRTIIRNNYNYLSVPILFGYMPTEGITLQVGPEFSYALNTPASGGPAVRNDLGLVVGIHYDFLDMLEKMSLHMRYIYGFNNISDVSTATYQNRAFQLSLVYNFYKKEK